MQITEKVQVVHHYYQWFNISLPIHNPGLLNIHGINFFGRVKYEFDVKIGDGLESIKTSNEVFNNFTLRYEVATGQDVTLECQIPIYGIFGIYWEKDDNRERLDSYTTQDEVKKYSRTSKLHIRNVTMEDGGTFVCMKNISNGDYPLKGRGPSKTIIVIQSFLPKIQDLLFKTSDEVQCSADGYPAPAIFWFTNDESKKNLTDFSQSVLTWNKEGKYLVTSTLNPSSLDAKKSFLCVAENSVGTVKSSIDPKGNREFTDHRFVQSLISVFSCYLRSDRSHHVSPSDDYHFINRFLLKNTTRSKNHS